MEIDDRPDLVREINWRDHDVHQAEVAARLQFQFEYAQSALKTLVLVNGGAIIGLFTFIGNDKATFEWSGLKCAFASLVIALFLSMFAYFGAFFSQANYMNLASFHALASRNAAGGLPQEEGQRDSEIKYRRHGNMFLGLGVALAFASLGAFALGSWFALSAIAG